MSSPASAGPEELSHLPSAMEARRVDIASPSSLLREDRRQASSFVVLETSCTTNHIVVPTHPLPNEIGDGGQWAHARTLTDGCN